MLDDLATSGVIGLTLDPNPDEPEWCMSVCGDWAPQPGRQQETMLENPALSYGDLSTELGSSDVTVVNLECPLLAQAHEPISKDGDTMYAPGAAAAALQLTPITVACLANNHIMDFGVPGLRDTLAALQQQQIGIVGAGFDRCEAERPLLLTVAGRQVAIVNAAEGEESRSSETRAGAATLDAARIALQVRELREQVEVIVVIVHAGREYLPFPAPFVQRWFRAIAAAGPDIIVGHHPHVPQGIEIYRGVPIIYSLGNFLFHMESDQPLQQTGFFVKLRFAGSTLRRIECVPFRITETCLEPLNDGEKQRFFGLLAELSEIAADTQYLEDLWDAYADVWLRATGIRELTENAARLPGGTGAMVRGLLAANSHRFDRGGVANRLGRMATWRTINWLDRRATIAEHPDATRNRSDRDAILAAAILRNRFDTESHRILYLTALERLIDGDCGKASRRAQEFIIEHKVPL